ncbi:ferritin-like fold-containing protein [Georgenia sp. AZ-5]|uniref:ferritin-like fold-containing protein n=1 Tax=Georgenia sp. AZ-5 TaxID=3367526 RepID=UPI0037549458
MPEAVENPAVVDLVGLHSSIQLSAFTRLAKDAQHAPDLPGRVTLSRMAAGELAHLDQLERLAGRLNADFYGALGAFDGLMGDLDRRTPPGDWWERLMKTYVAFGVLTDLQRELSGDLPAPLDDVVGDILADNGHADFVVAALTPVVAAEPQLGARLALWGRRVVGEALGIAQRALDEHPRLLTLLGTQGPEGDPAARVRHGLSGGHARRMDRLGLTA